MSRGREGRRRLSPAARRAHLLRVGLELLAEDPKHALSAHAVAARAGTTPGLLYRYFSDQRAFELDVLAAAADQLREATRWPAAGAEGLRASLRAEVEFASRHAGLWRALHRRGAGTPVLERLTDARVARLRRGLGGDRGTGQGALRLRGWLGFRRAAIDAWLDDPTLSEEELVDLLADAASAWLAGRDRPRDRKPRVRLMGAVRREPRDGSPGAERAATRIG